MTFLPLTVLAVVCLTPPLLGQAAGAGRPGPRPSLPETDEIALARSGAPSSISGSARIFVFSEGRYRIADSGVTAVACLVNRSWPASLEPECFDEEAAVSIMPMEIRRTELYHQGRSSDQVEREIAAGIADGTFRLPTRMAVVYMMSAGQQLISDEGRPAGNWKPHLMIHSPYLTNAQVGHHRDPDLTAGMVVDPGKPTANLMIVVPEFVPAPEFVKSKR